MSLNIMMVAVVAVSAVVLLLFIGAGVLSSIQKQEAS